MAQIKRLTQFTPKEFLEICPTGSIKTGLKKIRQAKLDLSLIKKNDINSRVFALRYNIHIIRKSLEHTGGAVVVGGSIEKGDSFIVTPTQLGYFLSNDKGLVEAKHIFEYVISKNRGKFADLGGGLGDKSILATILGFKKAYSVESDVKLSRWSAAIVKKFFWILPEAIKVRIIQGDFLSLDIKRFNVLYNDTDNNKNEEMPITWVIEKLVACQGKAGTVVIIHNGEPFTGEYLKYFNELTESFKKSSPATKNIKCSIYSRNDIPFK